MRNLKLAFALTASLIAFSCPALAQSITGNEFATQTPGKTVVGVQQMCINPATSQAVPCGTAGAGPTQSIGITPTDRTIASTSGASQRIMAANASRHSLTIVNNGPGSCGINPTGGTAAIGSAGTMTITAFGSYTPRIPTLSELYIICPAGQSIYGDEN